MQEFKDKKAFKTKQLVSWSKLVKVYNRTKKSPKPKLYLQILGLLIRILLKVLVQKLLDLIFD